MCPSVWKRREFGQDLFGQGEPTSPWECREWLRVGLYNGQARIGHPHPGTQSWLWRVPAQMAPQTGPSDKGPPSIPAFPELLTWEEIRTRNGGGRGREQWLVIDRKVYDVTQFSRRHPGGSRVIGHYAGQDATVRAGKALEEGGSSGKERRIWWGNLSGGGHHCARSESSMMPRGLQDVRKSPTNTNLPEIPAKIFDLEDLSKIIQCLLAGIINSEWISQAMKGDSEFQNRQKSEHWKHGHKLVMWEI